MTLATLACYSPVARKEHLDRLALEATDELTPEFWAGLHDEIQTQLASLEVEVRREVPGVRVQAGRTQGERFVFIYRTFSLPSSGLDPVVAGITFMPAGEGVTVDADISGEQRGDDIANVPRKRVASSRRELLASARALAQSLCQNVDAVAAALKDPSRTVE